MIEAAVLVLEKYADGRDVLDGEAARAVVGVVAFPCEIILGEVGAEIVIEDAVGAARDSFEGPAHPPAESLDLR